MKRTFGEQLVMWRQGAALHDIEVEAIEPANVVRLRDPLLGVTIDLCMSELHDLIREAIYE